MAGESIGDDYSILGQQPTDLIHQCRPSLDLTLSNTMEGLDVLLLDRLNRHKPHVRPTDSFVEARGIVRVVFLALDLGLHKLGLMSFTV